MRKWFQNDLNIFLNVVRPSRKTADKPQRYKRAWRIAHGDLVIQE